MAISRRDDARTTLAFVTVVVILGANFVAVRLSNAELSPFWGAGARFLAASLLLFLLVFLRRLALPRGRALASAVLFGVLAFFATYALAYWSLLGATAGTVSVLFATLPLSTVLLARLHGLEPVRPAGLAGALLALAGIAIVFRGQADLEVPWAFLAAGFAAAVCAAEAGVVVKRLPRAHPFAHNAVAMGVGGLLLLALSRLYGEPWTVPSQTSTRVALAWLIVAGSMLAFVLLIYVLGRWAATATSYQAVLSPLVTVAIAWALLEEPITWELVLGAGLVLAGVWLGALWRPRPRPASTT